MDFSIMGHTMIDPNQMDQEKELQCKIQVKVDVVVKECMEWKDRILHSVYIVYLTHIKHTTYYNMPTFPYSWKRISCQTTQ